ncbi:N-acetyltransferase [Aureispira anguillae]|uniref:GNAT family N-acetyltransferase n=1 Tax=Aureispira anguillae TaxID=2864201 RepID=A0A915YG83_9BACT|nr:N-acetyltransferase [Aureispira anguillae]BDS12472.1 GNAT family N-acetyltransferase [Aureispira anguillae]
MDNYQLITLNEENIGREHICCAFTNKNCAEGYQAKKDWLKNQFKDGYTFKKFDIRGKVFIEYVPAEMGWVPIVAPNYMLINCFWVSGRYKGNGLGKQLYQACLADAQDKDGLVVVTAAKKQPFMSEKKFFHKQGFQLCDTGWPYFELWYKPFHKAAAIPQFKACAKEGISDVKEGISVYYTNACPFTTYYTNVVLKEAAQARAIPIQIHQLATRAQAQNHFVPHTIYSVFYNGKFVTQQILTEKSFDKFIKR